MSSESAVLTKRSSIRSMIRSRDSWSPFNILSGLLALLLTALALYPFLRVLIRLVWVGGRLSASALSDTLAVDGLWSILLNTVIVVVLSGAAGLFIGSVLAWLNERTDARMGAATDSLPLINLLLPPIAASIGWVLLLSPRSGYLNWCIRTVLGYVGITVKEGPLNIYSWYGLIFVYTLSLVPFAFLMVSAGLRNLDPSLEEQSRVAGAGFTKTLLRVTLPAVKPSLMASVFLMIWTGFGLFSVPLIIGSEAGIDILSVEIVRALTFSYPPRTGVAVGLGFFIMLALGTSWYFQRRVLRSGRHGTLGGKGQRVTRIKLGKWRPIVRGLILCYIAIVAVLPILALLLVSLSGFWTLNIDWGTLSIQNLRDTIFDDPITTRALQNSLRLGVAGASSGVLAAAIIALWVRRTGGNAGRFVDLGIKFPAAVSHIVLAVGFILAFGGPPFNLGGTILILFLAYLALYMPQAAVAADAALSQVAGELPEASRISGATNSATFRRVYLPLLVPGLVAGWALLFVRMVGDLTASALLSGTSNVVVGFRILEIYTNGSYADLASLAVVLTFVSAVVLLCVLYLSRRLAAWSHVSSSVTGL